jgi:hypothetical protein
MRLDHFGHNYEFSVTTLPDAADVLPATCSRSWHSSSSASAGRKLSQPQADRLPLHSVSLQREGAAPDQRRNARVNALDSE